VNQIELNSVIPELPSSSMSYVITHSATDTRSERFRRRHLYLATLITAQLEAISKGEFCNTLLSLDASFGACGHCRCPCTQKVYISW